MDGGSALPLRRTRVDESFRLICIVDDEKAIRDSIASLIRSAGYRSAAFASAEAFLASESLREAHCVLLDLRLPGLSGLELQRRLCDLKCSMPVIFVAANADARARRIAIAQGAAAFLVKPFADRALLSAIQSALDESPA